MCDNFIVFVLKCCEDIASSCANILDVKIDRKINGGRVLCNENYREMIRHYGKRKFK